MQFTTHFREGLRNLYFSRLRTFLALLGILVGTASVVAMVLGGELATHEALKQFKTLGTDLFAVNIGSNGQENFSASKTEKISLSEMYQLKKSDHDILQVAPYSMVFLPSTFESNPMSPLVLGVTSEFTEMMKIVLQKGRSIKTIDHFTNYVVLGQKIYQDIRQLSLDDPIGKSFHIGKYVFTIIGVMEHWPENSFVYADLNSCVLIPLELSLTFNQYITIENIIMQLRPNANINHVQASVTKFFEAQSPDKQINFRSAKELIKKMQEQSDILTVFLGLIGSISLLVGGIGVMNIMLVSVIERRREIGIRMAVGARQKDIALLFLCEALVLSMVGGVLGILIGLIIAIAIAQLWHWEFIFMTWPLVMGFAVSVLVGLISGFYPAYSAAKLNPIDALRM